MLFLLKIYIMVIDAYLRATIIYPFSCNNLKDRRAITSVVMPEFFWILSANFSDATQPWSNSLLDHVTRNNSTFHVEHISCAYFFFLFFPSNVILARSYIFFFYSARNNCFPKWINHRSNHTCAHVYNYSTVLFWTIDSQLYYLQKIVRFQNSTIFFFFNYGSSAFCKFKNILTGSWYFYHKFCDKYSCIWFNIIKYY